MTNRAEEEHELDHEQAELVAKKTSVTWRYFGFRYGDAEQKDVLGK
ncbi:hypothetical protein P3449_26670 [Vibrio parahaemolyticus]|nr:hypothetical protein [Vibrio parahaemolyticus]MDG2589912.1 hypothetical protein [Vibrio parahaemolyticus]